MNKEQLKEFYTAVKHHFGDSKEAANAATFGMMWQEEKAAAEKVELLMLLTEIYTTSPAGSQFNPWIDTRVKLRKTLEKYGLI